MTNEILPIGKGKNGFIGIRPEMANRHGLVAGATGTGKTVSLRVLAEHFSSIGVPVFMADVKGDLGGIFAPGGDHDKVRERVTELGLTDFEYKGFPVTFWDVFQEKGHPVRTTISEMGPLLLSRLLNLNEIQSGLISLAFRIADDEGLLLLDFDDLRSMVTYLGENAKEFRLEYGNISSASIGAIQRALLALEEQGADFLFGEPALDVFDFMQTDTDGRGMINILNAEKLMLSPKVYATFLLWLLSELFENLPEVGDPDKPGLVFFFDEAHLLFDDAPKALKDKIEQVVRLIRSKGVGVYFVTQNPMDLPDPVLGQLGNRVQHALRAYTPKDQKAVRAAAQTFRVNPDMDTEAAITALEVGEALISVLDEEGAPTMVERALVCPPMSRLGTITAQERVGVMSRSLVKGVYDEEKDRESAHELLLERRKQIEKERIEQEEREEREKEERRNKPRSNRQSLLEAITKSTLRSVGSSIGRRIARGILGGLLGK